MQPNLHLICVNLPRASHGQRICSDIARLFGMALDPDKMHSSPSLFETPHLGRFSTGFFAALTQPLALHFWNQVVTQLIA